MTLNRLASIGIVLLIIGCQPPGPITVPSSDEFTIYARGLSTDQLMEEDADAAAALNARNELATSIETHIKSLTKRAREQIGIAKNAELNSAYSTAIKMTVDQTLNFSVRHSVVPTKWDKSRKGFRAEVVYKISTGPVNQKMLDNLKERKNLYERFRTTGLFDELEEAVKQVEEKRSN